MYHWRESHMSSPPSFLLLSLVKWKLSFVVLWILHFRNEREQKIPSGPFFGRSYPLGIRDCGLWIWSDFSLGGCVSCLICFSVPLLFTPPPLPVNRAVVPPPPTCLSCFQVLPRLVVDTEKRQKWWWVCWFPLLSFSAWENKSRDGRGQWSKKQDLHRGLISASTGSVSFSILVDRSRVLIGSQSLNEKAMAYRRISKGMNAEGMSEIRTEQQSWK